MNPILKMLNRNLQLNQQTQNNPLNMFQQILRLSKNMTPQQAQQIINQKVQSGEINQQQFEQAKQQAQQIVRMFGINQ